MVAQVRCLILIRGLKKSCDKIRKEMGFEEEHIEKETNHYRMICSDYYPCDMLLEFSFEDLANEFSVDISYLFCKFDDQLCEYNEDYNLDSFLDFNGLSTSGSVHGFKKETGIVDDLKILNDFLISERNTDSQSGNADLIFMRALQALGEYNEQLIRE